MSNREKLLGLVVGVLLGVLVVYGVVRGVQNGLRSRQNKISSLTKKIQQEQERKLQATADAKEVLEFKRRSLDADPDTAHLDFNHWLDGQAEEVGLKEKIVRYNGIRQNTGDFKELTYNLRGDGNLQQVTDLLYRIQAADTLHRIERFSLRQSSRSNLLALDLSVSALSMGDVEGQEKVAVGTISESKLNRSKADYEEAVVVRNIFAPANNAPRFGNLRPQTVELGRELELNLNATDADGHALSYSLLEAPDDDAEIQGRRLFWKPSELGNYEMKLEVVDDGLPAKSDITTVSVRVVPQREREAPPPAFDAATVTRFSGVVWPTDDVPRMWLIVQSEDQNLSLAAGDAINIGTWQGKVKSVDADKNRAVLEAEDGQAYELALGQNLSEATPLN